jgi:hypothetical protein
MRRLRAFFRLIRRTWGRRSTPSPETRLISSIDPKEFSDLLISGRKNDLKTLADRLSDHGRTGNVAGKAPGRTTSSSKGSGVAK